MDNLYEWFYDTYAQPKLAKQPMFQDKLFDPLLETLPADQRLDWLDFLNVLKINWCTAAFTLGVRTGLRLGGEAPGYFSSYTDT